MKTRIIVGALSVLTAIGAFAAEQTWTGVISDKMCGADHKMMAGKMSDREIEAIYEYLKAIPCVGSAARCGS